MTSTAPPPAGTARQEPRRGELSHREILTILLGLALGMFLAALDQTVVSTAIRTIADDLGGLSQQAWATTAFLITGTISTPLYGKLSDIYGRKPLFLTAISIFIVGSVLCTFATSMYVLAAFRAVQGLGAGGLFALALTILGDIVPPRERARYQGYILAVFGTSSVLGPVIGGVLSGQQTILGIDGWRWIFLVNVPIGAIALIVVAKVLNVPHTSRPHRIDWPGALALAIGLVPLLLVAEQGREWGWLSTRSLVCYGVGVVGLVLFVLAERAYGDDALLPLRLFGNRIFTLTSVAGIILGMGMFGGIALLPQFLQIVHGATPTESGFMMLPLVGGIMVGSVASGQITSRTGHYKIFPVIGTLLMTGAMLLLHFRVTVDIPIWELDLYMAMFGLGLGCCMQTLVLAVQNAVPARDMGVATASATFFRQMGGTLGTAIFLSIMFSTVADRISDAFRAAAATPQFRAALTDRAVAANPANQQVLHALTAGGDTGDSSGVLNDSSFLQHIDPRLARPFLQGFTESMTLAFLVAACVVALAFVTVLFIKELPLRTMSGAQARLAEDAATPPPPGAPVSPAKPLVDDASAAERRSTGLFDDFTPEPGATGNGAAGAGDEPGTAPFARIVSEPVTTGPEVVSLGTADAPGAGPLVGHTPDGSGRHAAADPLPGNGTVLADGSGPALTGIVHRADGSGIADAVVTVTDASGTQEGRTVTGADGGYRVPVQAPGTYLLVVAAGSYPPYAAMVGVAGAPVRHDVPLAGRSGLRGIVVDAAGLPARDCTVTLIDRRGDVAATVTADAEGRYLIEGVPAGHYTLTVTGPAGTPIALGVELVDGRVEELPVLLPRKARLTGTVTARSSGTAVPEALATLLDSRGVVVGSTVTGPDGRYTFTDLAPGDYTLITMGYAPIATAVRVGTSPPHGASGNGASHAGNGAGENEVRADIAFPSPTGAPQPS